MCMYMYVIIYQTIFAIPDMQTLNTLYLSYFGPIMAAPINALLDSSYRSSSELFPSSGLLNREPGEDPTKGSTIA